MPELGEVARIVNRLRTHLVGKTILRVTTVKDTIVYKDTTHEAFKNALEGKMVLDAKQWGKYFWLVMNSPPHPLMHLGMDGWMHCKDDPIPHYRSGMTPKDWPPTFLKFNLQLDTNNEIAFTDYRRIARIRLIDHEDGNDLRNVSPLKENGPDPVLEPIALAWFTKKLQRRLIPVKTWLLDQTMIAGIGNLLGDEILWHSKIHPNTKTNNLTSEQIAELHRSLLYVTKFTVDVEADRSKFPSDWLAMHRLGGNAGVHRLPTGERVESVKIGGRTSVFVPSVQGGGRVEESEKNQESKKRNQESKKRNEGSKKRNEESKEGNEESKEGNEEKDFEAMKLEANAKGWLLQRRKPLDDGFEGMRLRAKARGWLLRKRAVEEDAKA